MWPFIEKVLEQYGLLAVVLLAMLGAFAWIGRRLWKDNLALNAKLHEVEQQHKDAMLALSDQHAQKLADMQAVLGAENLALQKQLAAIQEKRVDEARAVTERVVTHVQSVDNTMQSLDRTLEVLLSLAERGNHQSRG